MAKFSQDFIREIPKTDLHLHLDGSLRINTLIELAKDNKVELPSYNEEGLNSLVFKKNYSSLQDYLKGFAYTCGVLQTLEALERVAYELAYDNWQENVRYCEIRFAPQLHMDHNKSFEQVVGAVDKGLRKAKTEINKTIPDDEPRFEYGIIVCAMRFYNENFSHYYNQFIILHKYSNELQRIRLASEELARATVQLRNNSDIQIVGFDLAGSEYGYPADNHEKAYSIIHNNFIHKTVHAGEAYGPESIFLAISKLHTERIGHGLFLFNEDMVYSKDIKDKKNYVNNLVNYIADRRITIEVCLTSNLQTVPSITDIKKHSFSKMLDNRLSVSLCTDNRLISHTTVTNELNMAIDNFEITPNLLKNIIFYGFKRSFFYHPYRIKRKYVRKVIDYYESIEKKYNISK